MIVSHFKRMQLILFFGFMMMLSSAALSIGVMVSFFEETSKKLDVLVKDAYASNTMYDVNIIEYTEGNAYFYTIPPDRQTLKSAMEEYKNQCSLECEESCPDSIRVTLLESVFDRQQVLQDTMIYK